MPAGILVEVVNLNQKGTDPLCTLAKWPMVHTTPTALEDARSDNSFPTLEVALNTWSFVKVGVAIGTTLGILDWN